MKVPNSAWATRPLDRAMPTTSRWDSSEIVVARNVSRLSVEISSGVATSSSSAMNTTAISAASIELRPSFAQ